jgi:hypothetical protein
MGEGSVGTTRRALVSLASAAALLSALVVPVVLALSAPPAGATPASVTDPAGDVHLGFSHTQAEIDRVDLTSASVDLTPTTVTFNATTVAPATTPTGDDFNITWDFDTTGGDGQTGFMQSGAGRVWYDGLPSCPTTVTTDGTGYHASFAASCIDHPYELTFSVWTTVGGGTNDGTVTSGLATADGWTRSLPSGNPFGHFESAVPGPGETDGAATVQVGGWAIDPDTGAPIDVAVYLNGKWQSQIDANGIRRDVGNAYADYGDAHGFSTIVPVDLTPGVTNTICVFAINSGPGTVNTLLGCKAVPIPLDGWGAFGAASTFTTQVSVWGSFIDPTGVPGEVQLDVDGTLVATTSATMKGAGWARLFPRYPDNLWGGTFTATPGTHDVCAYGVTTLTATKNNLGCRPVVVGGSPFGHLDSANFANGHVAVTGWAIDPDTILPITVVIYFTAAGQATRGLSVVASWPRPDVGAVYPGFSGAHGFNVSVVIPKGTWTVTAFAINTGNGTRNPDLGSKSVTVS